MRQANKIRACTLGITAAFALAATPAQAQQQEQATETATARAAGEAQALRAVRDKATGKLRAPTAEEREAMEAGERAARGAQGASGTAEPAPLRIQTHANGMRSAVLGPDYLLTLRGERRADGSVRRFHPHGDHDHSVARDNRPVE